MVKRDNGFRILFDGRRGGDGMCGVVELNASGAFYDKRYVAHGFVKKHAKAGRLLETGDGRDVWSPSRYQDVSFRNVEVSRP
jgi:carotenoid cleavage dioxygenase-like enzyme